MLIDEIHSRRKVDSEELGVQALAAYYHPKLKTKFSHLSVYDVADQFKTVFGAFLREKKIKKARPPLEKFMSRFIEV
jgi:hypothetical protein